jgi:glycosyltransferase involved in cell wall biosynthesis
MRSPPKVDVVVPVYNEEVDLARNIPLLRDFLAGPSFPCSWRIIIGDNGSTDRTPEVSRQLADQYPGEVTYFQASGRGKGRVIKEAWLASDADIVSFMDVDLSTELDAFPALIRSITDEGCDLAIGSRAHPQSIVRRSWKRRLMTRVYNALIRAMFGTHFSDAQCGFKAASADAASRLLPLTEDLNWFLDTELLVIAEKAGYRIAEVPITWVEDEGTSVRLVSTISSDLAGLVRLRRTRPWKAAPVPGAPTEAQRR